MTGTNALADAARKLLRELEWVNEQLDLMPDDYAEAQEQLIAALRTTDHHDEAEAYRNRAEQALAERDVLLVEAAQIIGQIELDHRYPPAPDSMERRIERARDWLARAALEGNDANNTGEDQ